MIVVFVFHQNCFKVSISLYLIFMCVRYNSLIDYLYSKEGTQREYHEIATKTVAVSHYDLVKK